jgi:hypothetical protein
MRAIGTVMGAIDAHSPARTSDDFVDAAQLFL